MIETHFRIRLKCAACGNDSGIIIAWLIALFRSFTRRCQLCQCIMKLKIINEGRRINDSRSITKPSVGMGVVAHMIGIAVSIVDIIIRTVAISVLCSHILLSVKRVDKPCSLVGVFMSCFAIVFNHIVMFIAGVNIHCRIIIHANIIANVHADIHTGSDIEVANHDFDFINAIRQENFRWSNRISAVTDIITVKHIIF